MSCFTSDTKCVETGTIEQRVLLDLSLTDAYEIFMDASKQTAALQPKVPDTIDRRTNGALSLADGFITGHIISYACESEVSQSWTAKDWPVNHFSRCDFKFQRDEKSNGTFVTLKQTGVPKDKLQGWVDGWYQFYWNKLKFVRTESSVPAVTAGVEKKAVAAAAAKK